MAQNLRTLRALAPTVASGVVVVTLVTCLIITKSKHIYTGGLKWPYFSDMGRDAPAYYVFCVGLSLAAVMLACTWAFNYQFQRAVLSRPIQLGEIKRRTLRWATTCAVLGMASVVGLPVLAFFSTSSYPSLHNNAAYWFFLLETVAVLTNLLPAGSTAPSVDDTERFERLRRTSRIQLVFAGLFFVAFLIYLPIGLAIIDDFKHLTIAECLERDLGTEYCTVTMKRNATETKLWNYEDDFTRSQLRAGAQLGCILTLVGYSLSFLSHDYEGEVDAQAGSRVTEEFPSTHFYTIPVLRSPSI
ncbi:hypothetical protein PybrP1_006207 [[Pythium] brassicae (nom. inval.)]|nr:hypothetical protein PybrP1_006207 [[Pythium] brassicae (nom. inval.)]